MSHHSISSDDPALPYICNELPVLNLLRRRGDFPSITRSDENKLSLINLERSGRTRPDKFILNAKFECSRRRHEKNRLAAVEDAILELEQFYNSVIVDDEDLLDRAERRDLPSKFQLMKFADEYTDNSLCDSTESIYESGPDYSSPEMFHSCQYSAMRRYIEPTTEFFSYSESQRVRAPAYRRSAIPDKIQDDLAFRKFNKRQTMSSSQLSLPSYLLCSHAYTPGIDVNTIYDYNENDPNIDRDDLFYRKLMQAEAANVLPRHPPFGVPLHYFPNFASTDYLQVDVKPDEHQKMYFTVKPKLPDVIKDDLAFRTLRKDKSDGRKSPPLLPVTTINVLKTIYC